MSAPQVANLRYSSLQSCATTLLAFAWLLLAPSLHAQTPPVLIQQVISREYSIHVGGVSVPEDKEIVSREFSIFVGDEPSPPLRQIISREVSIVVTTPEVPARVTPLTVPPSPMGDTVTLSWTNYNEWAEHDVARYDIYMSTRAFTNISEMTRYATVPAETRSITLTNLPTWEDHFFAVVAVDAAGGFDPGVNYAAAYAFAREVVTREFSVFVGDEPSPPLKQLVSREISIVVTTPEVPAPVMNLTVTPTPTGESVLLSWVGYNEWAEHDVVRYDIYMFTHDFTNVARMTRYGSVPAETFSVTLNGLPAWEDHFFAVVPVDALGGFDPTVKYAAAYVIAREVVSREFSVFVGGDSDPPVKELVSREVSVVVSTTNVPAPVTCLGCGFTARDSVNVFSAIDLDWTPYNEVGQMDVVRYRVYLGPAYFDDVSEMEPYEFVPAETKRWTVTGLDSYGIYYLAVVAEDVLGQWNPVVRSASAQASIAQVPEVRDLQVACGTNWLQFAWQAPLGADPSSNNLLASYRVYLAGATTPVTVDRMALSYTATNLLAAHGYPFRITTLDISNRESQGASLLAATLLDPPVNVKAWGLDSMVRLTWQHVEPYDLVYKYAFYMAETNFSSTAGLTPILLTRARRADIHDLTNGQPYYFAVSTINISGGESALTPTVSATPDPKAGSFADLVATNLAGPLTGYPGRTASFSWRVINTGAGSTGREDGSAAESWTDRIILSPDDTLGNAADVLVAEIRHNAALEAGAEYFTNVTAQIPWIAPGSYHVFVAADALDEVYEYLDAGNNEAMAPQFLTLRLSVPPPDQVVNELQTLVVTNLPAAPDLPPGTLSFALIGSPPAGMSIDALTGVVTWTPTEAQGPSTNLVQVQVSAAGVPPLSETNRFTVVVNEVNSAPVFLALESTNFVINPGEILAVTNGATDGDIPSQTLAYALASGPVGAELDTSTGVFIWQPGNTDAGSVHPVTVVVSDNGSPSLSATQFFQVTVRKWVACQVSLLDFAGPLGNGDGRRAVAFAATGGSFPERRTQTLDFVTGLGSCSVAVPPDTTHLSAKTAWSLRKKVAVTLNGTQEEANFTGASALPAGDLDESNTVDLGDYLILAGAWYTSNPVADLDGSGWVDLEDYFLLASHWNEIGEPE